ncbi:unnamed protein product [Heligmosomoides polygyrus]|uniref:Integrase catalytic domain-containing protein n=1 Tax=Heligmosomoides polygyrus TaxID=6339 RepID=A0A3P8ED41_HELPZ|nr:unnamed protein product [Heligmosomoides polygyrus]
MPAERVTRNRPFGYTGLDYFGPLVIRAENGQDRKIWVCLFTCTTKRAIHLEMVADNSTIRILLAFRRFISRSGTPDLIMSDIAATFKTILVNELKNLAEHKAVQEFSTAASLKWRLITPLSPWKGGFYERLVGSVKTALKKTVQRKTLDLWNLQTLLSEIEATLNTRPVTPMTGNTAENARILRPLDLINPQFIRNHKKHLSCLSLRSAQSFLRNVLGTLAQAGTLAQLWYLQALADRNQLRIAKKQESGNRPKVGDVVLMQTDNTTRSSWPLGLIVQVNKSADEAVRSANLKTGKQKLLDRSANQFIPLEITADAGIQTTRKKEPKKPTRIQPPRRAKNIITR